MTLYVITHIMSLWCQATEHLFINQHTKAADLHKEINKIGIIDTLQRWGDLPLIPIYCTTKPSSSLKCNMNDA